MITPPLSMAGNLALEAMREQFDRHITEYQMALARLTSGVLPTAADLAAVDTASDRLDTTIQQLVLLLTETASTQ